jgi:tetratricopeptide (TPR) repeat protein
MAIFQSYRSFFIACSVAAAAVLTTGCSSSSANKEHQTMKQEQSARWNATRVAVMLQLATQQYQVGDYDKCRETLQQAFAMNFPSAALHTLAARVELEKGSLEVANTHLKTAVQLDAADPEAYYLLGVLYQRWQNNQAAHDYYSLASQKKPGEAIYLLAVVEMEMAMRKYDDAQRLLEDKVIYFEQSAAVRAALAKIYTLKGQYDLASKFYREATILSPDDASLRRNLAESYFFAGHYNEALPVLERIVSDAASNPNPDPAAAPTDESAKADDPSVHLLLARTYMALHRIPEARNVLADIVHLDPHNDLAWLTLGKAALEMGDVAQASNAIHHVLKDDPNNLEGLIIMAAAQQKLRAWPQAQQTLERAAKLAPTDATVLCMLGLNVQNQGKPAEAADFYNKALAAKPDDSWAQELLASTGQAHASAAQDQKEPTDRAVVPAGATLQKND